MFIAEHIYVDGVARDFCNINVLSDSQEDCTLLLVNTETFERMECKFNEVDLRLLYPITGDYNTKFLHQLGVPDYLFVKNLKFVGYTDKLDEDASLFGRTLAVPFSSYVIHADDYYSFASHVKHRRIATLFSFAQHSGFMYNKEHLYLETRHNDYWYFAKFKILSYPDLAKNILVNA